MSGISDPDDLDRLVVIGLGSNLAGSYPSREALLEAVFAALANFGIKLRARSSFWSSTAWPDPTRPEYLNAVALVEAEARARPLLSLLLQLEQDFGRRREELHGDRTLDLDLIAYGRERLNEADFVLPHPRAAERRFVMGPLAEIAPTWRHPLTGEAASTLAVRATVGEDARPVARGRAALHNGPQIAI
jgi:2-amino-4-hydroxy-6-hydroxymethyldihydropteridine diphosphokinase